MADLVRHYGGEFIHLIHQANETAVEENVASGTGKGVESVVLHEIELERKRLCLKSPGDVLAEIIDVVVSKIILNHFELLAHAH